MKLPGSFINHILLISRKIQLEGGVGLHARVVSVQSLCLNLKIDILYSRKPVGFNVEGVIRCEAAKRFS